MKQRLLSPFRTLAMACLALLLAPAMAFAQDDVVIDDGGGDDEKGKKISGGYGYFTAGYSMYTLDEYNEYFAPYGHPALDDNGISLGGGGFMMIRNIILGGEGHGVFTKRAASSLFANQLESGWGQFQAGYIVVSSKGLIVYPKLGFGGYTHTLRMQENVSSVTLDTIAGGYYPGSELTKKGLLGSAEAGLDWMPGFDEASGGGIVFGLSVGYNFALTERDWEAYGTTVTDGPNVDLSGLYVKLRIGFGGWNRQ